MITAAQMRAARALLGIDQRALAELSGLSLPTIQRMEASDGVVRGNVDSLMKLVGALQDAGIELIADGAASGAGRPRRAPARPRRPCRAAHDRARRSPASLLLLGLARRGRVRRTRAVGAKHRLWRQPGHLVRVAAGGTARRSAPTPSSVTLPLGLPWIGAHFRLDPLAAFFLVVVGLGSAGASLYALGYGRHEHEPQRVLPFYPAFLAGMNLVVIADDAFSFLFAWELMSLASWALVMAHHREPGNARAGFVYIIMASFAGLALLLCFGLLAGRPAATPSPRCAPCTHRPASRRWRWCWR